MESELQVLNNIQKNTSATQRDIAKSTGMSLGNVNVLIKRLVKKGLLKIEKLNSRTIRYILTPVGMAQKAQITYGYIISSYRYINEINAKINAYFLKELNKDIKRVILYGACDELGELIQNNLKHLHTRITLTNSLNELIEEINREMESSAKDDLERSCVVSWQPEYTEALENNNIRFINLLEKL